MTAKTRLTITTACTALLVVLPGTVDRMKAQTRAVRQSPADGAYVQASVTPEEEQFVRKLANELTQTIAVVAANPDASFEPGTLAARVRTAYMRLQPARRKALRPASMRLLSIGGTGGRNAVATTRTDLPALRAAQAGGLSPALRSELRSLIGRRLDQSSASIAEVARSLSPDVLRMPRTWIEGGVFGESKGVGRSELTLSQPQVLGFRWKSDEPGAAVGFWELVQQATGLSPERVLATGTSIGKSPSTAVQGSFEIDFVKYLPATPPASIAPVYHVRIKPLSDQRVGLQRSPGPSIGMAGKASAVNSSGRKDPDGVGPWSAPVIIHYGRSTTPPQKFTDSYRRIHFYLDSIRMIEDQQGPGAEEFYVAGFVQENALGGAKTDQHKFGPYFAKLDPDGPRQQEFGKQATFGLPPAGEFPRLFTVVLTVLEEDDGGMLQDWIDAVWEIAKGALKEEVDEAIKQKLEDLRQRMAKDTTKEAFDAAKDFFNAATTADFCSAWLKMAVAIIAAAIEGGRPDDYYGTEVVTFLMPTNEADFVRNEFAFQVMHRGASERLTGQAQADQTFRVKPKAIRFHGQPSYPEAGSFDGIVDVTIRWVLSGFGL